MTEQERHDVFRALVAEQDARLPSRDAPLAELVKRTYLVVADNLGITEYRVRRIAALGVEENWIGLLGL